MVKLTLKQCAYFVAVAEQGGIAQASRVLNISQPAVAQALEKLEQLFDFRLFERHHARGTELTPQGRAFLESARKLLQTAHRTEHDAQAIAADLAGIVRIGCFHSIAPFFLPQIISAYGVDYPQVEISSAELRQDEILNAIEIGEIDLALTYDMSLDRDALQCRVLARLKPFLLLDANHIHASRTSISLAEMAREPFVMFEGPSSRDYFEGILSAQGINPPVAYCAKSMESVRSAVSNGLGFSLSVMKPEHPAQGVVTVPIADEVEPLAVVLLQKRNATTSTQVERFSSFCEKFFEERYDR